MQGKAEKWGEQKVVETGKRDRREKTKRHYLFFLRNHRDLSSVTMGIITK